MKCPICPDSTLAMSSRNEIEIDYCPSCRGVWLDRGELDKLIEKSLAETSKSAQSLPTSQVKYEAQNHYGSHESSRDSRHDGHYYKYKRKKSFLEDIFD